MGVELDVLRVLEKVPRQSPKMVKKYLKDVEKLDYSISQVKNALNYHAGSGHATRVARGIYEITELGKYVLHHQVNVQDLGGTKEVK